jgi:hypothetical protein
MNISARIAMDLIPVTMSEPGYNSDEELEKKKVRLSQ